MNRADNQQLCPRELFMRRRYPEFRVKIPRSCPHYRIEQMTCRYTDEICQYQHLDTEDNWIDKLKAGEK